MSIRSHEATCVTVAILALTGCQQPTGSEEDGHEKPVEQTAGGVSEDPSNTVSSSDETAETSQGDPDAAMDQVASQMVNFGAGMNAVGYACGIATQAESNTSRTKLLELMARGYSAAGFERAYDAAFKREHRKA